MPIYAVKTVLGREKDVAETLAAVAERKDFEIFSILVLPRVRGFVFVEASSLDEVYMALRGLPYIKGIVRKEVPLEEIAKLLKEEEREIEVDKGDIVEIIGGPFKGERAKVLRVDKHKKEVTVEIIGAVVPIPVTLSMDDIRVVEKAKKQ